MIRMKLFSITAVLMFAGAALLASGCSRSIANQKARLARERAAAIAATQPSVPRSIAADGRAAIVVHAVGNQVYVWETTGSGGEWKLKEPAARFWNEDGSVCGKHNGSTFELTDGSRVVARRVADEPSSDPDAVPWLLLEVTSREGTGKLETISHVQRINTCGGLGPSTPGTKAGDEMRVPFAADYVFCVPPPSGVRLTEPATRAAE
jgi:hypothetical protein